MSERNIIGREEEKKQLRQLINSKEAQFLALYGRRRVGKTFLVREFFPGKGIYLEATGLKDASLSSQLKLFAQTWAQTFGLSEVPTPQSWLEAFEGLTSTFKKVPKNKKIIVFLDELPWMAGPKSGLLQALDYYWNRFWSSMKNLLLIVCGSAASWMLDHLIMAKGGLYNRVTARILLKPFNLKETQVFLEKNKIFLKERQVLDLYMAIGGIPFYLKRIQKGRSVAQNIDDLCFSKSGLLYSEFSILFKSLFTESEVNAAIIRALFEGGNILSRDEILKKVGLASGGTLNRRLDELEASDFIKCFIPLGKKQRGRFYRIVDEYTLFYLKWIEPLIKRGHDFSSGYWQKKCSLSLKEVWSGLSFESVVFKHLPQIERALGIASTSSIAGSWRYQPKKGSKKEGAQIDLLFDRADDAITLVEIKYSHKQFVIDKSYAKALDRKIDVFADRYPTKGSPTQKQLFLAMVITHGVKKNMYKEDLVHSEVVLSDLFC